MEADEAALIDTDVFSLLYVRGSRADPRVDAWRRLLLGRSVVISLQTQAELFAGAAEAGWKDKRLRALLAAVNSAAVVEPDEGTAVLWARLRAECMRAGHGLGQKVHDGDRWVAATAMAVGIPLLAGDGIYRGAPGVQLLDEGS